MNASLCFNLIQHLFDITYFGINSTYDSLSITYRMCFYEFSLKSLYQTNMIFADQISNFNKIDLLLNVYGLVGFCRVLDGKINFHLEFDLSFSLHRFTDFKYRFFRL